MTRNTRLHAITSAAALGLALTAATGCDDDTGASRPTPGPTVPEPEATTGDEDPEPEGSSSDGGDETTGGPEPADHDALDQFILGLGHLTIDPVAPEHQIACDANTMECLDPWQEGDLTCNQVFYAETQHLDSFIAITPDSPALWPGALLRAGEMPQGVLSPIGLERSPATFSLSLENLNASPKATMENPTLSEFRDLRAEMLQQGTNGNTAAQISYEIHRIFSKSQFALTVGADFSWSGIIDFDAMYDFQEGEFANKYLIDFTQTYYTADIDTPARPSDMFGEFVDVQDAQLFMGVGDPPMYLQSISYGRRVLFAIESNDTLEVMVAAIDAAFGDGIAGVDVDVGAEEVLNAAKITATVIGGNAEDAVATILGPEEMIEYILEGGNYSSESPGVPIAYKTAYLDNSPGRLSLTAIHPVVQCE
jgi:thiol-activated cytolysin